MGESLMRTFILIAIVIGASVYLFMPKSNLSILMAGERPFVETEDTGIFDVEPSKNHRNDIRVFSESGHITVVEFYDPKCKGCKMVLRDLEKLSKLRPDVTIKLIHMSKNYYGYWGEHYGLDVPHVPFTVIIDSKGEILAMDKGHENDGQDLLYKWANAETQR